MSDATPAEERRDETPASSNGTKWKWIIGIVLALALPALGFAAGYGSLEANAQATAGDVVRIEKSLETHKTESAAEHRDFDRRLDAQTTGLAEQKAIMQRVEKNIDKILDHVQEQH